MKYVKRGAAILSLINIFGIPISQHYFQSLVSLKKCSLDPNESTLAYYFLSASLEYVR